MAKVFIGPNTTKRIISRLYERNRVIGLICELCWLRNFRVGDIRFARVSDFRKLNGQAEYHLRNDKTQTNEWLPIPNDIYRKIAEYIKEKGYKPNDHVFKYKTKHPGVYENHIGIITHEWIEISWYAICKDLGIYTENPKDIRDCGNCVHAVPGNKCNVYGWDRLKSRCNVHIKKCLYNGKTKTIIEKHPRIHESLRGGGAQYKIEYYMNQGLDYETALLKVFNMSNWRNLKTFRSYIDPIFEKKIGNRTFSKDFGNMVLVDN